MWENGMMPPPPMIMQMMQMNMGNQFTPLSINPQTMDENKQDDSNKRRRSESSERDDSQQSKKVNNGSTVQQMELMDQMNNMIMMAQGNIMNYPMLNMQDGFNPAGMMMPNPNLMAINNMQTQFTSNNQSQSDMESMAKRQLEMLNSQEKPMNTGTISTPLMGMMMMDPNLMTLPSNEPIKEPIELKTCKLIPPKPTYVEMQRRARPPGCRTVFVGGLPEGIERNALREIFERYGQIYSIRFNNKNFCHIRFEDQSSVEAAFTLTGYKIMIENEEGNQITGNHIHVDYAQSRDDQQEYEHQMERERRDRLERLKHRSPSPPKIVQFTGINSATMTVAEDLKNEEKFASTVPILISWLERGEVNKKNANVFFTMIQATSGYSRRLINEKAQIDDEYQNTKEKLKQQFQAIISQFEQVEKVLNAAQHKRVWDHFTKPQRNRISTWHKLTEELQSLKDEYMEKFDDEEMDIEGEKPEGKSLKKENENLHFQLEAYRNEIDVLKNDLEQEVEKRTAQRIATLNIRNLTGDIMKANSNEKSLQIQVEAYKNEIEMLRQNMEEEIERKAAQRVAEKSIDIYKTEKINSISQSRVEVEPEESRLLTIIASFLSVHPHGASVDYLCSYVQSLFPHYETSKIDGVLTKHKEVFEKKKSGVGANLEYRWHFIAYNT